MSFIFVPIMLMFSYLSLGIFVRFIILVVRSLVYSFFSLFIFSRPFSVHLVIGYILLLYNFHLIVCISHWVNFLLKNVGFVLSVLKYIVGQYSILSFWGLIVSLLWWLQGSFYSSTYYLDVLLSMRSWPNAVCIKRYSGARH